MICDYLSHIYAYAPSGAREKVYLAKFVQCYMGTYKK